MRIRQRRKNRIRLYGKKGSDRTSKTENINFLETRFCISYWLARPLKGYFDNKQSVAVKLAVDSPPGRCRGRRRRGEGRRGRRRGRRGGGKIANKGCKWRTLKACSRLIASEKGVISKWTELEGKRKSFKCQILYDAQGVVIWNRVN